MTRQWMSPSFSLEPAETLDMVLAMDPTLSEDLLPFDAGRHETIEMLTLPPKPDLDRHGHAGGCRPLYLNSGRAAGEAGTL
ncbi:hypothetical protein IAQ61_002245 [Plenodomus lingam]|uniref:uncharacterized protein n=1 Tax=Leptosphaeria maculans TaxID=5022 RepID=UPI0033340BF7|nr:hypothetical protein IAQ61_002245 [Plenodomus lingam]